jgi:sulfotransferase family protein
MSTIKEILRDSFLPSGRQKGRLVPTGFVPITSFFEEDVFVVGYPKSGNTWFQDIVAGLAFGALPQFAPQSLVQDLVPDVHAVPYYKRHASQMFFKSHALPTPDHKRVVYLLRDGRDAMVSYYHHIVNLDNKREDFLETVLTGRYFFPCRWHEHIEAWLANPFQSKMIVIRYEELKNNPVRELQRFCDFAGLNRSPEFLKMIADETVFEKMLDKEIKWRRGDPRWPNGKTFRRRGTAGSYKDEMPPEVLNAFLEESGDTLRRCGYL